ncbi:hypothetical protein Tco_1462328, partial [Tanacetum coccineum]
AEKKKKLKIINCDVITQKGPISLKVYREDGTIEVIANFKVSDLNLVEWREVLRRLGSIFTSVYVAVQKLKKAFGKEIRVYKLSSIRCRASRGGDFMFKSTESKKETKSSSAKDKSPNYPLPPTPMVGEMHKEAQQAAGGPTSLGATSKEGSHP